MKVYDWVSAIDINYLLQCGTQSHFINIVATDVGIDKSSHFQQKQTEIKIKFRQKIISSIGGCQAIRLDWIKLNVPSSNST